MRPNCFEVEGYLCGVQSCDESEANIFIKVDGVCQYARLIDSEVQIPLIYSSSVKSLFINHKSLFLSKIKELNK